MNIEFTRRPLGFFWGGGRWTRPRDLCVLRNWRREQDGSFIILYQSTTHVNCPKKPGVVRAHLHGTGVATPSPL